MEPDEHESEEPSEPIEPIEPIVPISDPIGTARRRHGTRGAILAAGMLGIDQVYNGRKVKQEAPIVVDAASEPVDLDSEGITVPVDDETDVVAPPLPRTEPVDTKRRRTRRR